jgi:amino acid transporter
MATESSASTSGTPAPAFITRRATGLVRQVPIVDTIQFNASATGTVGAAMAFSFFWAMVAFPRTNIVLAFVIALLLCTFTWFAFALLGAVMPKVGGDYTYNGRILSPAIGLGGNLGLFISSVLSVGYWAVWVTSIGIAPAFAIIGTVTGQKGWLTASTTLASKGWTFVIAVVVILLLSLLSIWGTKLVIRTMTWLYAIGLIGLIISIFLMLFTSHAAYVTRLNNFSNPITHQSNTYLQTISAAGKAGLAYPNTAGFSFSGTMGTIYVALTVTIWVFWSAYIAGEMKGGGRRKRQLTAIFGAGWFNGILFLIAAIVFLRTVGYNFFAAANSGAYKVPVSPYWNFFSSIATSSHALAIILGLTFIAWFPPAVYINLAMCHRAPFAWAFDGLFPRVLARTDDRTHTPVVSILITGLLSIGAAAGAAYSSSFGTFLLISSLLGFVVVVLVGIAALLMPSRRAQLYKFSPADWKLWGVPVLPVAGIGCAAVGLFAIVEAIYFHTQLGLKDLWLTIALPFIFIAVGFIWYAIAQAAQRSKGVDLALVYKEIPPD